MNLPLYVQRKSMLHLVRFSDRCFNAIRNSALLAVLGTSMSVTSSMVVADWPEFRGDGQNGVNLKMYVGINQQKDLVGRLP